MWQVPFKIELTVNGWQWQSVFARRPLCLFSVFASFFLTNMACVVHSNLLSLKICQCDGEKTIKHICQRYAHMRLCAYR